MQSDNRAHQAQAQATARLHASTFLQAHKRALRALAVGRGNARTIISDDKRGMCCIALH
jgi:hypothetical protein